MTSPARLPSPTLRVEEGDHVAITLYNTHYLPHTIHLHGTSQPNNMDGVPHMTQHEVEPGKSLHLPLRRRQAGHLLVSLPRAGPCPSADGARRHADHRAEPAAQSLRASHSRRRPHHVDGEGDARGIPERVFARVHGHRRPAQPHSGRLSRSARDREAHASRLRRRRSASPTSSCSTAARSRSPCATRRSW